MAFDVYEKKQSGILVVIMNNPNHPHGTFLLYHVLMPVHSSYGASESTT